MDRRTTYLDRHGTRIDVVVHPGATPTNTGRPPALLLHPWFGCRAMWDPMATRLDTPTYALDWYSLADHVGPDAWQAWASPHGLARASVATLDSLGLEQVDIVGNSVGGIVAQLIAAKHPERVRRLVLIGTGATLGGAPTAFGTLVSRWLNSPQERPLLTERLVDALVARPFSATDRQTYIARVRAANPEFIARVLVAARDTDLRPSLRSISAPTLVLRGEHDTARSAAHVAELITGISGAHSVELAGLGHSPMVEDADLTAMLVCAHFHAR